MTVIAPKEGELKREGLETQLDFVVAAKVASENEFLLWYEFSRVRIRPLPAKPASSDPPSKDPVTTSQPEEDLAASADDPLQRYYDAMTKELEGITIKTRVDNRGRIDNLALNGTKDQVAMLQGNRANGGDSSLMFLVQEDGLNSLHAGGFVRTPAADFTTTQSWEHTTDLRVRYGTIRLKHSARFAGREVVDGDSLIRFDTKIANSLIDPNPNLAELMAITGQEGAGTLHFNETKGHLVSYKFQVPFTMKFLNKPPGAGQDESAQMLLDSDSRIERIAPEAETLP